MSFPLNDLQTRLGYKFENIQLLHEALTYDFDSKNIEWDVFGDGNVFYPKSKLHRLKCVGVSVLKLLIAEKAVIAQKKRNDQNVEGFSYNDEGFLTEYCKTFHRQSDFLRVSHSLLLWNYIHCRYNTDLTNTLIIKEVFQAIFGAVFIDGGGCESKNSYAMKSVRKLLDLLINKYYLCVTWYPSSESLYSCFTKNCCFTRILLEWENYSDEIKPSKKLVKKIGYDFKTLGLIETALTHDSLKGIYPYVTHYEVLEFLGDAVYELVICEYLFWHYINDRTGKFFNAETLKRFVSNEFQKVIANELKLQRFIIKPRGTLVKDIQDFLESIIGAIYVDAQSLSEVKTVLIKLCKQFEDETEKQCSIRLPFARKTYYGSMCYRKDEKPGITGDEHELPPKKQDTFKIFNLEKLKFRLGNYYNYKPVFESIHSCDSSSIIAGTESWCNQQEFQRVSLFQTIKRIEFLEHFTGKKLGVHKYDHSNIEYVFRS